MDYGKTKGITFFFVLFFLLLLHFKTVDALCTHKQKGEMPCFSWLNPGQIVIHRGAFGPLQPAVVGILSNVPSYIPVRTHVL